MSQNPEHVSNLPTVPPGIPVRDAIAQRVSCRAYQPTSVPQVQLMQIL
jgi:hypothetical protein